jgi:hypothetical protein
VATTITEMDMSTDRVNNNMKKLTIPNIDEKLKGEKIGGYVVGSIDRNIDSSLGDSYVINCVDPLHPKYSSLTIHLIREIHTDDEHRELVKVWMELNNGKRTAVFRMWIEHMQSMEDWVSGIDVNIRNRGWY